LLPLIMPDSILAARHSLEQATLDGSSAQG
jgi:hypothetical protein